MSYPPLAYPAPHYHGVTGEHSATVRRASQPPELLMPASNASYLATTSSTGGLFGLYRWDFTGPRSGPDPHFHRTLSESFFVLSGTVRLFDGKEWVDATAGDYLYVPEGGVHGFRNESGEPASMLLLFAPGAPREAYFEGLASLPEEDRARFFEEHDTYWV